MKILSTESNKVLQKAQTTLQNILTKYHNSDVLLMLSGGSALSLIDTLPNNIHWENITITTLDERYTHNDKESNFANIINKDSISFIKGTAHFIDPRPKKGESLKETTKRFDVSLHEWYEAHPNGKVIATVGMGEDGHTAGILPFPENTQLFEELFNQENIWVQGYSVSREKNPHTERITVTNTFLQNIVTEAIVYICGKNKKEALKKLLSNQSNIAETPAIIINNMKTVSVVTNIQI